MNIRTISLLALTGLAACGPSQEVPKTAAATACIITPELSKLIRTDTVDEGYVNAELEFTGSVSYDQDHIYRYQSLASGVIQQVNFNLGDYVEKGKVLATLKTAELSGQKSELHKAEAELNLARRNLQATRNLHQDGVASDKDLLEATNTVVAAESEIGRIKETLTLQGGSVENGQLVIRAPMSGYIVAKKITNGYQVDAGEDDLFVLSDLKKVWVMANVYAAQLGSVAVGQKVDIVTTAYSDKVFSGSITRLSNIFDAEERVLKAVIALDNNDLALKPSMMVRVNVQKASGETGLRVPRNAALFVDNSYRVIRCTQGCQAEAVAIDPISSDRNYYYLASGQGLSKGDTLITRNPLLIYNKLKER